MLERQQTRKKLALVGRKVGTFRVSEGDDANVCERDRRVAIEIEFARRARVAVGIARAERLVGRQQMIS